MENGSRLIVSNVLAYIVGQNATTEQDNIETTNATDSQIQKNDLNDEYCVMETVQIVLLDDATAAENGAISNANANEFGSSSMVTPKVSDANNLNNV